jgi:hypothetical protein
MRGEAVRPRETYCYNSNRLLRMTERCIGIIIEAKIKM